MTDAPSPASPAETTIAPKPTPPAFDADPEGVAEHVLVWRDALREAVLPIAAERGWTRDALRAAELADPDLGPGIAALACPAGVVDVLDHWGLRADQAMARTLADNEAPKRIRDKVAAEVSARVTRATSALGPAAEDEDVKALIFSAATDGDAEVDRVIRVLSTVRADPPESMRMFYGLPAEEQKSFSALPADELHDQLALRSAYDKCKEEGFIRPDTPFEEFVKNQKGLGG